MKKKPQAVSAQTAEGSADSGRLKQLLRSLEEACPEHAPLIAAFTPLLLIRERLTRENPEDSSGQEKNASGPLQSPGQLPVDAAEAQRLAPQVLEAVAQGFPAAAKQWEILRKALDVEPELAQGLCLARRDGKEEDLVRLAREFAAAADAVALYAAQILRILAARHASALPETIGEGGEGRSNLCPYCGARPELSVISGREGKRFLLCSQCGRHWRYTRTACPLCGEEGPEVIRHIFVEGQRDLRAALCGQCNHYLLEADIRERDLPLELCHALTLIMGHLDALAQDEDALPLSLLSPESRFAACGGHA